MNFSDSETRLRRMLRDPDSNIWDQNQLIEYFNDAQREIQTKTGVLMRVEAYHYPPRYTYSFMFDWEWEYLEGDLHQCFTQDQNVEGMAITYPWETAYWLDTLDLSDDGYRCTHPWEMASTSSPADVVVIPLDAQHSETHLMAWDQEPIEPISERKLAEQDPWYKTHSGTPSNYYQRDDFSNSIALYPRPTAVWDDSPIEGEGFTDAGIGVNSHYYDSAYMYSWENSLGHTSGSSPFKFTRTYGDYEVTYGWEEGEGEIGLEANLSLLEIDSEDTGISTDTIQSEDTLLTIYEPVPEDIVVWNDESAFPDFLVKYVEFGTLERAYGVDTDGFIPSLRDYWRTRKEIGINAIKRYMHKIVINRKFQIGGPSRISRKRRPRLPDSYADFY